MNILKGAKAGHGLSIGGISFSHKPNRENYYEDQFSLSKVQAKVTNNGGMGLRTNIKRIIKDLPETDWYVIYLKSTSERDAWFRLKLKY